jgi:hypothetical protein
MNRPVGIWIICIFLAVNAAHLIWSKVGIVVSGVGIDRVTGSLLIGGLLFDLLGLVACFGIWRMKRYGLVAFGLMIAIAFVFVVLFVSYGVSNGALFQSYFPMLGLQLVLFTLSIFAYRYVRRKIADV